MEGLESFFTASKQLDLLLMSFVFGIPIGIVYDIFRAVRLVFPHGRIAVLIEDLLFFFIYGVFMMTFTVTAAGSEFRFFYPICNALGFIVYFVTAGSLLHKALCKMITKIKMLISKAVKKLVSICAKIAVKFRATLQIERSGKKNHDNPLIDEGDLLYNSNVALNRDTAIGRKKKQKKEREKIWQQTRL